MGEERSARHKKKARKLNAILIFADESGLLLSPLVKRSWAPKGETPIMKTRPDLIERYRQSAASRRPSPAAGLIFRLHPGKNVGAAECVAFLEQIKLSFPGRHVFVIWDGLRAHWSKKVERWLKRHPKIQTFKLPAYAPELNQIEYVWGNIKYHQLANLAPESEAELLRHDKAAICNTRGGQKLIAIVPATRTDQFFCRMSTIIYTGINS